jgi:hypothetical protein
MHDILPQAKGKKGKKGKVKENSQGKNIVKILSWDK